MELLLEFELRRGRLRRSLTEALRAAIQSGRLPAGTVLPSSRRFAIDLGVSRGVVTDAYDQLVSEGYLDMKPRFPPVVAAVAAGPPPAAEPSTPRWRFDFNATTPDVGLFPRRAWIRAVERALRAAPDAALDYGDASGRIELRIALSAYLARVRGVRVDPGRIVVTQGFSQALDLLCRVLSDRGATTVAMETPSHPELWATVRQSGLGLVGCPVDSDGLRTDELSVLDADAAVVTPAHQFPTGVVMAPARRLALVDWAAARGALVIEDDYDAEFRYDRKPVGAVQGLDPGRVAHVGSASKTLAPGVRLGWISPPADLFEEVRIARSSRTQDRQPSTSLRSRICCLPASTSATWFVPGMNIGGGGIDSFEPSRQSFLGSGFGEPRPACRCSSSSLTWSTMLRSLIPLHPAGSASAPFPPCTSPQALNAACYSATVVSRKAESGTRWEPFRP